MAEDLTSWLDSVGRRHGFLGASEPAPAPPASSSDPQADFQALEREARGLHRQLITRFGEVRQGMAQEEAHQWLGRINSIHGRVTDRANAQDAQEMRRVVVDLREMTTDLAQRERELRASGAQERGAGRDTSLDAPREGEASDRGDASFEELEAQARELYGQAVQELREVETGLSDNDRRAHIARLNGFNGRIRAPQTRGNVQEMRRIVSDLQATISDFQRSARDVDRATDRTVERLADGDFRGERQEEATDRDTTGIASAREDASFQELQEEAQELHDRATRVFEELRGRLDASERTQWRDRLNTTYGRVRDPRNQGDPAELRRVIADLRAANQDLVSRRQELG